MGKSKANIRYFRWEGDACRMHTDANDMQTADLYRGGRGVVPIQPADLLFGAVEINEEAYRELVLREIERRKPAES